MANTVKKRDKVPSTSPKRKQRMVCLMSEEEVRIVDAYLKKYKISNKARWLRETVLTFIHQKIGIIVQQFHRLVAVYLIGTHRQLRRQLMAAEEFQQMTHADLEHELLTNGFGLFPGDTGNLCKPGRLPFHNGKSLVSEMLHDSGSGLGTDTFDLT